MNLLISCLNARIVRILLSIVLVRKVIVQGDISAWSLLLYLEFLVKLFYLLLLLPCHLGDWLSLLLSLLEAIWLPQSGLLRAFGPVRHCALLEITRLDLQIWSWINCWKNWQLLLVWFFPYRPRHRWLIEFTEFTTVLARRMRPLDSRHWPMLPMLTTSLSSISTLNTLIFLNTLRIRRLRHSTSIIWIDCLINLIRLNW